VLRLALLDELHAGRQAGAGGQLRVLRVARRPARARQLDRERDVAQRSSRSISDGPLPIANSPTEASATLPFVPAYAQLADAVEVGAHGSMRTRMGAGAAAG
jgi:hypothetical protein